MAELFQSCRHSGDGVFPSSMSITLGASCSAGRRDVVSLSHGRDEGRN